MCFTGSPLVSPVIPVFPFCLLFLTVDPHPSSDTCSLRFTVKHQPSDIGPKPFTSRSLFPKIKVSLLGCSKWNYCLPLSKWGSFPISPHFIPVEPLFFIFKIRALKSYLPMASSLKSQVSAFFVSHSHLFPFPLSATTPRGFTQISESLLAGFFASNLSPFQSCLRRCQACFPRTAFIIPTSFLQFATPCNPSSNCLPDPEQPFPSFYPILFLFNNFFQASIFPSYSLLFCVTFTWSTFSIS